MYKQSPQSCLWGWEVFNFPYLQYKHLLLPFTITTTVAEVFWCLSSGFSGNMCFLFTFWSCGGVMCFLFTFWSCGGVMCFLSLFWNNVSLTPPFCVHTWFLFVAIGLWVFKPNVPFSLCQIWPVFTCAFPAFSKSAISCLPVFLTFAWFLTWPCLDSVFWILLPLTLFDYWIFDLCLPVDYSLWIVALELY